MVGPRDPDEGNSRGRLSHAVEGFMNLGNTCYAAAAVQCLISIRPFIAQLDGGGECADLLIGAAAGDRRDVVISNLLQRVNMPIGEMNDADEFLRLAMSKIDCERPSAVALFRGIARTTRRCMSCSNFATSDDTPFTDVSMIPSVDTDVQASLASLRPPSIVDCTCEACHQVGFSVTEEVVRWPSVIRIHVRRYGDQHPIAINVQASVVIDGGTYMLVAAVVHLSEPRHFVAYVKVDGVWWRANDATVSRANPFLNAIFRQSCHSLFYLRQTPS